jgi:hypothetical protein
MGTRKSNHRFAEIKVFADSIKIPNTMPPFPKRYVKQSIGLRLTDSEIEARAAALVSTATLMMKKMRLFMSHYCPFILNVWLTFLSFFLSFFSFLCCAPRSRPFLLARMRGLKRWSRFSTR